jgi:hypothetical protein
VNREVKIVSFSLDKDDIRAAEKEVAELVNQGWVVVTGGGGGGGYGGDCCLANSAKCLQRRPRLA